MIRFVLGLIQVVVMLVFVVALFATALEAL